jgi:hypothetical protein
MDKKIVKIGDKTYTLLIKAFDDDVEVDDLLQIDYSNLIGELVTFPVIVNRIGIMLAEAESAVSEKKLNLEVFEAKMKERLRTQLAETNGKAPTVEALNNAVLQEPSYQATRKGLINAQKTRDYLNSVFWSAKDKSNKLDRLSLTIQAGDIPEEVLEGRVNSVILRRSKKLIEDAEK